MRVWRALDLRPCRDDQKARPLRHDAHNRVVMTPKPMNVFAQHAGRSRRRQPEHPLQARLRPSVRHPDGLPRCQRARIRDGRWHQCQRAARRGFRVCGFHGAGFAVRERAGTAKNPAAARLVTGRYATLDTLAALAPSDPRAFYAYAMRLLRAELDRVAENLEHDRQKGLGAVR